MPRYRVGAFNGSTKRVMAEAGPGGFLDAAVIASVGLFHAWRLLMRVLKFTALVAITAAIAGCESEVYHEREHVYHDQPRVYQRTDHYYDSDYSRPRAEARVDVQS